MANEKKLTREQAERIVHAMDEAVHVMHDIEETGKNKRICAKLDKAIGYLYEVLNS